MCARISGVESVCGHDCVECYDDVDDDYHNDYHDDYHDDYHNKYHNDDCGRNDHHLDDDEYNKHDNQHDDHDDHDDDAAGRNLDFGYLRSHIRSVSGYHVVGASISR